MPPSGSWSGSGLVGALGGYLVLFGPLVLVPVALADSGVNAQHAGLALTALPGGFALAATAGSSALPRALGLRGDRRRCQAGALLAAAALGALATTPLALPALTAGLAVLGVGLGLFTPANNALIMAAIPARSAGTGGGLVNLARGLGTALGVALPVLTLHLADRLHHHGAGPHLAMAVLLLVVLAAMLTSTLVRGRGEDGAGTRATTRR